MALIAITDCQIQLEEMWSHRKLRAAEKTKRVSEVDYSSLLLRVWCSPFKAESSSIIPAWWYWHHMVYRPANKQENVRSMQNCKDDMKDRIIEQLSPKRVEVMHVSTGLDIPWAVYPDSSLNPRRYEEFAEAHLSQCFMLMFIHVGTCDNARRHHTSLGRRVKNLDLDDISVRSFGEG